VHRLADRIIILENGRKVIDTPKTALSAEALEQIIREAAKSVGVCCTR
jgi:simple sugar transport system ATP-binding protein